MIEMPDMKHFSPYGKLGDVLWVRESHYRCGKWLRNGKTETGRQKWRFVGIRDEVRYIDNPPRARIRKNTYRKEGWYKRVSIHMPKWACRLRRTVKRAWVERVQDISEEDIKKEGIWFDGTYWRSVIHPIKGSHKCWPTAQMAFEKFWDSIYGEGAWDRNDHVFATEFEKEAVA